jgi:hypothetical protein
LGIMSLLYLWSGRTPHSNFWSLWNRSNNVCCWIFNDMKKKMECKIVGCETKVMGMACASHSMRPSYIKATCVSVRLSVATKTRRGPETSEVLKTFEDLNRGGQNSAGQGRAGRPGQTPVFFFCFFCIDQDYFFFF